MLERALHKRANFEELAFHLTNENFEEVKTLFLKYKEYKFWLQQLIDQLSRFLIYNYKLLGDLFSLTGKPCIEMSPFSQFHRYLLDRGIITMEDYDIFYPHLLEPLKTIEEYEKPIKEGTLEYYIYKDDIYNFVKYITTHEIDINEKHIIKINGQPFSKIAKFVCFSGSTNILKYLIINNVKITDKCVSYAIDSGSEEMIGLLVQMGYSFNNLIYDAIMYHHNRIAKWLWENYEDQNFELPYCVYRMNTEMLLYFLNEQNRDINERDVLKATCLHYSSQQDDLWLTIYLLLKGINPYIRNKYYKTALDYAETKEMSEIFT